MKTFKILNLYAGIGGNRKKWKELFDIDNQFKVTAIENDPVLAKIYQNIFPNDEVVVGDAHQYLLEHYKEFDFIWSSPPCQTHSSFRHNICVRYRGTEPVYPDMTLYEEILFLKHHFEGKWVVENVKPYYKPLIEGKLLQRHLFWSNFDIPDKEFTKDKIRTAQIPDLQKLYGYDLSEYKIKNKRQVLRNCVSPELGLHVLKSICKTNPIK
jgi:DNA (cytosine-5)-methyltransferase 1